MAKPSGGYYPAFRQAVKQRHEDSALQTETLPETVRCDLKTSGRPGGSDGGDHATSTQPVEDFVPDP